MRRMPGSLLDMLGHHRASCTGNGRVKTRATPTECMTARVSCEAGASTRRNVFLMDMNVNVPAQDSRHIEVLAEDIMLRSVVRCDGEGGVRKPCRPMKMPAHSKARDAPHYMQFPVALMWKRRWTRMLAIACAVSFASSLMELARNATDVETPLFAALCKGDRRWAVSPCDSSVWVFLVFASERRRCRDDTQDAACTLDLKSCARPMLEHLRNRQQRGYSLRYDAVGITSESEKIQK